MKAKILVLGAVITAFTLTTFATDALLSPRAQDNQPNVVTGVANDPDLLAASRNTLLTPRAFGNRSVTVKGVETFAVKCPVMGSPKYVAMAGSSARTSCCNLMLAECATMDKMPK